MSVPNTEQGLEIIHRYSRTRLFLDLMMPGIDGWELCSAFARARNESDPGRDLLVINDPELLSHWAHPTLSPSQSHAKRC